MAELHQLYRADADLARLNLRCDERDLAEHRRVAATLPLGERMKRTVKDQTLARAWLQAAAENPDAAMVCALAAARILLRANAYAEGLA